MSSTTAGPGTRQRVPGRHASRDRKHRMRQSARIALLLLTGCGIALAGEPRSPVDWVNPYIGTGGSDNGPDYGGMAPLVTAPFGMTNWTAQTRQNRISVSSYAYEDG